MLLHLHLSFYFILFGVALIAAIFDTMVGGGGLITLPAILMTGMSPYLALGTNKLQSSFGSGSATLRFALKERTTLERVALGIVCTAMGAIIGSIAVLHVPTTHLQQCIPPILLLVLLFAIFSKRAKSNQDHPPRISYPLFMIMIGFALGFYDAFLGPGTGAFWAAAIISGLGFSIRKATIYTKVFNLTSNIVSLLIFIIAHQVIYSVGLTMAAGQFLGGQVGAHLVLKKGHTLIRPIYITVVSILLISLSYKTYFAGCLSL